MKYTTICLVMMLFGCSSIKQSIPEYVVEQLIEHNTDIELGYSEASCYQIRNHCAASSYSEWQQKNGDMACSCQSNQ